MKFIIEFIMMTPSHYNLVELLGVIIMNSIMNFIKTIFL